MSAVAVHDVWFVPPCDQRGVVSVAAHPTSKQVAVLRRSGSVEIWLANDAPLLLYSLEPDFTKSELKPKNDERKRRNSSKGDESDDGCPSSYWATAIAWSGERRLFAVGAHGFIFEILFDRFRCAGRVACVGLGIPTCIDALCIGHGKGQGRLVVGTHNGHVVLFNVDGDGAKTGPCFERRLAHIGDSRIVSVSWRSDGLEVAVGTEDGVVCIVRVSNGKVSRICSADAGTPVGAVVLLADGTVVVGEKGKDGRVVVYNSKTAAALHTFDVGRAGFCALAKAYPVDGGELESSVFCGGLDPVIYEIRRRDVGPTKPAKTKRQITVGPGDMVMRHCFKPSSWVPSFPRRMHERTVTSMAYTAPWLISGSADGDVYFSKYPPKVTVRFPALVDASRFQVLKKARLLMVTYGDKIMFHRLEGRVEAEKGERIDMDHLTGNHPMKRANRGGRGGGHGGVNRRVIFNDGDDEHENSFLPGAVLGSFGGQRPPLVIKPSALAAGGYMSAAAALDDGSMVAYSVSGQVRLAEWEPMRPELPTRLTVVAGADTETAIAPSQRLLAFESGFLSVTPDGCLQVLDCADRRNPKVEPLFDVCEVAARRSLGGKEDAEGRRKKKIRSSRGKICAAASILDSGRVAAVSLIDGTLVIVDPRARTVIRSLPRSIIGLSALAVGPDSGTVVVSYVNRSVLEFTVKQDSLVGADHFDRLAVAMTDWSATWMPPDWWRFDDYPLRCIIPQRDTHFLLVDPRNVYLMDKKKSLHPCLEERGLTCVSSCHYVAFFGSLSKDEFVCVYQSPSDFLQGVALPPFKEKKFGRC